MNSFSDQPTCRACGGRNLRLGIDLGVLPLANAFLSLERAKDPTPEPKYPLRVFYCSDCNLIQLLDIVNRREMFDDYAFLTATSHTSMVHFDRYADQLTRKLELKSGDLVVDIGSNDGTLLKEFKRRGSSVLGIEPARNVANRAVADGIPTLNEYFSQASIERIGRSKARVVTANNVLSHVGDLHGFVETVSDLLDRRGLFAFEVPWIVDVLQHHNFDIVYHEHLSYFGFHSLSNVFEEHGLELVGVEHFPQIHGGTIRGVAAHIGVFPKQSDTIDRIFHDEEKGADFHALEHFAKRVREFRPKLSELLRKFKQDGKTIVGYGAPAKATILLNYCSIDGSILDFVSDTTPFKQGKFIPGVRIPIAPPDKFRSAKPDYALLLAWNFKDEILEKEREFLKSGGKFIIPFPDLEVVG
jgi:SAM-dependent methyltransferase